MREVREPWVNPLRDFSLVPTWEPDSYLTMPWWPQMTTGIPTSRYACSGGTNGLVDFESRLHWETLRHPGAFGFRRKRHVHEGVDLYAPVGTRVRTVEAGRVVAIEHFTGPGADPPSPWWLPTKALLVEGETGVVVYGEIELGEQWTNEGPRPVRIGDWVDRGQWIGSVLQVLQTDKGRPMSMLHLELHGHGTKRTEEWPLSGPRPASLLDPTPHLIKCV